MEGATIFVEKYYSLRHFSAVSRLCKLRGELV